MDLAVAVVWAGALVSLGLLMRSMAREWIAVQRIELDARAEAWRANAPPQPSGGLGVVQQVPRGTSGHVPHAAGGPPRAREVALPDDLEAYVGQWEDTWARDDETAVVRAKYVELYTGDPAETWQRVRRAVGIGEMP